MDGMLRCIAKELAARRFYDEEKFMMLLRSVPIEVIEEWNEKYSVCAFGYCCEELYNRGPLINWENGWICKSCKIGIHESESDDDLDTRDANNTVLSTPRP